MSKEGEHCESLCSTQDLLVQLLVLMWCINAGISDTSEYTFFPEKTVLCRQALFIGRAPFGIHTKPESCRLPVNFNVRNSALWTSESTLLRIYFEHVFSW